MTIMTIFITKYTERDYYILVQNCISKIIVMNQEYYHINIKIINTFWPRLVSILDTSLTE